MTATCHSPPQQNGRRGTAYRRPLFVSGWRTHLCGLFTA